MKVKVYPKKNKFIHYDHKCIIKMYIDISLDEIESLIIEEMLNDIRHRYIYEMNTIDHVIIEN